MDPNLELIINLWGNLTTIEQTLNALFWSEQSFIIKQFIIKQLRLKDSNNNE